MGAIRPPLSFKVSRAESWALSEMVFREEPRPGGGGGLWIARERPSENAVRSPPLRSGPRPARALRAPQSACRQTFMRTPSPAGASKRTEPLRAQHEITAPPRASQTQAATRASFTIHDHHSANRSLLLRRSRAVGPTPSAWRRLTWGLRPQPPVRALQLHPAMRAASSAHG